MRRVVVPDLRERTITHVLRSQVEAIGDAPWLLSDDGTMSFREVDALSDEYAAGLHERGVARGDRVAVMMVDCPDFVVSVLGIAKLGAVFVPVNLAYKGEYLRRLLDHSGATAVLVDDALAPRVAEVLPNLPSVRLVAVRGGEAQLFVEGALHLADLRSPGAFPEAAVTFGDPFSIMYTSGTTGQAKGVIQSHHSWYRAASQLAAVRQVREGDVWYSGSPLIHTAGWSVAVLPSLLFGQPVLLQERFSVSNFWSSMKRHRVTQVLTMSAMHVYLWNQAERPDDADNPIRIWQPIPLAPELWGPFKERFGLEDLTFVYGSTECQLISLTPPDLPKTPGSAGRPCPDLDLQIQGDAGEPLPTGEVGEICVRPREPHSVCDGYFRNPEATVDLYRNLWFHTGDLGRVNEDGELFFVDRKSDYLRRRGENVSSGELESMIQMHPAVELVAAHAVPSELGEDEIKVCVVVKAGAELTARDLVDFCNTNLPHFMVPRYVEFLPELPLTPTGKIQKFALRERGITDDTWDREAAGYSVTK